MANVANHTPAATRPAYRVSFPANLFKDDEAGVVHHLFNARGAAERVAKANGVAVEVVELDAFDIKPNTKQSGFKDGGGEVTGRWTGRLYARRYGIDWTYIELKIDGEAVWFHAD